MARRSRVGGVGTESSGIVGMIVNIPTSALPPLSRLRRQLPSRGALKGRTVTLSYIFIKQNQIWDAMMRAPVPLANFNKEVCRRIWNFYFVPWA